MKKFLLALLLSSICFAGEESFINTTKSDIQIGYKICKFHPGKDVPTTTCNDPEQFLTIPALSKIASPFPYLSENFKTDCDIIYLTKIFSPLKKFATIKLFYQSPVIINKPLSFPGGAWILQDFQTEDYIVLNYQYFGPNATS